MQRHLLAGRYQLDRREPHKSAILPNSFSHEREGDAGDVDEGPGEAGNAVASLDVEEESDSQVEALQDGGHSKRRRLREHVDPEPPTLDPAGAEEEVLPPPEPHEEGRVPRVRPDPIKPTARERAEHNITHYPYRSWCRHCLRGRGASRPHGKRSEEDKEFSKGRVPTISLDHCYMGSEDSGEDGTSTPALENPFLIMYDADSEAIYCLPVASKAVSD